MTEFVMVCSEEALEPWQMDSEVIEIDDDDDDPIFVREVVWLDPPKTGCTLDRKHVRRKSAQKECSPWRRPPPESAEGDTGLVPESNAEASSTAQPGSGHRSTPQSDQQGATSSSPVPPTEAMSPQPVITNNQMSNSGLITPLSPQDPARASVTVPPAGYPALLTAAQSSLSIPQPAVQSSPATLHPAAQATNLHLLGPVYPAGAYVRLVPAGYPMPQKSSVINLATIQSPSQPSPVNLKTAHLNSAVTQPATRPRTVFAAIWRPAAQPNSVNLQTAAHPSSAIGQLAAQSGTRPQKWIVRSSPGTLQSMQTGDHAVQLKLPTPPKLQAPPTSRATREACSAGGTERSDEHPMNSDPKRRMLENGIAGTTDCPGDALELNPPGNTCPSCHSQFSFPHLLRAHMKKCCFHLTKKVFPKTSIRHTPGSQGMVDDQGKLVMLVSDFYYGNHEGDNRAAKKPKYDMPFTCPTCFRVLKNNIGFMSHMRYHLEVLWRSKESQDGLTTCQRCYRRCSSPLHAQLHTERTHIQHRSSTTCKICELAFETEQVLLEHMRDTHKPGEMPYACQVCNYRSSFFSEVENHFESEHKNTKELLCPFCLKVLEGGQVYTKHYMKHQEKDVHQCEKCRLNFLTYVEKVAHDALFHRTFKKPRILKGLPHGTEVVICTSLPTTSRSDTVMSHSANTGTPKDLPCKSPEPLEKRGVSNGLADRRCAECGCRISDFSDHFMTVMNCGECKYRTCCIMSLQNHKIRRHGALPGEIKNHKKSQEVLWGITSLKCLDCGFLTSNGNLMSRHLTDNSYHTCRVVADKGHRFVFSPESKDIKSEDLSAEFSIPPVLMECEVASVYTNAAGSFDGVFADPGSETSKESVDGEPGRMKIKEEHTW